MLARLFVAIFLLAGLGGCASVAPPSAIPEASQRHLAASGTVPVAAPNRKWWQDLRDPQLDRLVDMATERNHEVKAALAAVRQARALAGLAEREALPAGQLEAQAQRARPSVADVDPYAQDLPRPPARNLVSIDQMVSWEIDLFGRIGTAAAIAERQADMAAANAHAAMALVQGEAVRRYVQLRRYQAELALVAEEEQQLRLRRDQIAARVQGGVADRRHLNAADAELAKADAEREVLSVLIAQEKAALAVLVGSSPIAPDAQLAELLHANALPAVPESAVLVRPADLLARRPDVARADAALRAALGETVLAERAHLPRISLNLAAGLSAAAGGLGSTSAVRYAAGPLLQWDWLNSGRLAAREAAARAGDERAWHQFEQTVLAALEDSEGALGNWVAARSGFDKANDIERSLGEAARYAKARATAGLEAPVQYMDADLARVRAARNRVAGQNDALLAYARVQLALAAWQPDD